MVAGPAKTVEEYLDSLAADRRDALAAVRQVILDNLPAGYQEAMQYGMISYVVPTGVLPNTYNGQLLAVACLASQKNYMSVYLTNIYSAPADAEWFVAEYRKTGKRLDMGKSCVRFRSLDALPVELIGRAVARTPVEEFVRRYRALRGIGGSVMRLAGGSAK